MRFFIVLFIIVVTGSCQYHNSIEDTFYVSNKYEDLLRIPLIKPYEINSVGTNYWLIDYFNYDKSKPWLDRQKVDSFTIADSVIVIECNDCPYDTEVYTKYYTVIIPKNGVEKAFTDEKAFNEFLITNNIKLGRKFSPAETYLNWKEGEPLPWPKINTLYETVD